MSSNSVIILVINKSDSGEGTATRRLLRGRPILLITHDYRANWTSVSPITIINRRAENQLRSRILL